jgi:hypothetical protein
LEAAVVVDGLHQVEMALLSVVAEEAEAVEVIQQVLSLLLPQKY